MNNRDEIRTEIERLQRDGLIRPADVVEAAKDEGSVLHGCFTWDDGEAAHQFRLIEARNLIRVHVTTQAADSTPIRAFVSLTPDRVMKGGGYRAIVDVMSDEALYQQMLDDAFVQLRNVQKKYKDIKELATVWQAVDEAEKSKEAPRSNARTSHAVVVNG